MIKPVVGVRDRQLSAFISQFVAPTLGVAVRSFRDAVNDPQSELFKHPEDFELFHLADFDDESGGFHNVVPAKSLAIASNFKEIA